MRLGVFGDIQSIFPGKEKRPSQSRVTRRRHDREPRIQLTLELRWLANGVDSDRTFRQRFAVGNSAHQRGLERGRIVLRGRLVREGARRRAAYTTVSPLTRKRGSNRKRYWRIDATATQMAQVQ